MASRNRYIVLTSEADTTHSEDEDEDTDVEPRGTPTPVGGISTEDQDVLWHRDTEADPQPAGPPPSFRANLSALLPSFPLGLSTASHSSFFTGTPNLGPHTPLPPLSSDDIIISSPIVGTHKQRLAISRKKGTQARRNTIAAKKDSQRSATKADAKAAEAQQRAIDAAAAEAKVGVMEGALDDLAAHDVSFAELMLYVFDPSSRRKAALRWESFFRQPTNVTRILDYWTSNKNTSSARTQVQQWIIKYTSQWVKREAQAVTESGFLQTMNKPIDASFVLGFDLSTIYERLRELAPAAMEILESFGTSVRQTKGISSSRVAKKKMIVSSTAVQLIGEYSNGNNFVRRIMSLYMYATGSQRQTISVMSHLGISESYTNLTAKKRLRRRRKKKTETPGLSPSHVDCIASNPDPNPNPNLPLPDDGPNPVDNIPLYTKPGTLRSLSESMRDVARGIASTGLFGMTYDNINMMLRTPEQTMGRSDTQENGTCATLFPLWKASLDDMRVSDLEKAFDDAPPLSIDDILLTPEETKTLNRCLIHALIRIIVDHGGEGFEKFRKELESLQPETPLKIEIHQTPLHPIPAMHIDESTIVGNAEVVDVAWDELRVKKTWDFEATCKFFGIDQLSLARLRSILHIRAGQEGGYSGFRWGVWMLGLFHGKMADIHGLLVTHWGKPTVRSPGSLSFHNACLNRMPIVLSSLPPFRICRDLAFVSLYARVLHCLLLVSGKKSLAEYASSTDTFGALQADATLIFERYADASVVDDLRWKRRMYARGKPEGEQPEVGDMVFENAILFLRDALLSREFSSAVKAGDSGRIVLVLKTMALSFRGNGRNKYAYEMLHLIHNLTHIWPPAIRAIVLNNWLVNPTGKPNSWVEVDLMQEHMNFWIKNFYKAHGSAASWEWLEMVSPCVEVLRHLATAMKYHLGSDVGTIHEPADLTRDVAVLMKSLADHTVYTEIPGRTLDKDDSPAIDIISVGLQNLTDSSINPLAEYNQTFTRLQARCRQIPIVGGPPLSGEDLTGPVDNVSVTDSTQRSEETRSIPDTLPSENYDDLRHMAPDDEDGEEADEDELPREYVLAMDDDIEPELSLDNFDDVALDMDEDVFDAPDEEEEGLDDEFEGVWYSDDELEFE